MSYILVSQSHQLLSEIAFTPAILGVALALSEAMDTPTLRRFGSAGMWLGVSLLVRPTLLLFPLFVVVPLLMRLARRHALRCWLAYMTAAAVVVAPWVVHNFVRYHAVFPLVTSNAILWQGSPEYYHLIRDQGYTYQRVWREVIYPPNWADHNPQSLEGDRWWTGRALRSISTEPLVYLRYAAEKTVTYWVGDPNADWGGTYVFNYRALRRVGFSRRDAVQYFAARVLPLVALIAAVVLRRRWRDLLAIYALAVYCTLLHAATHAEARLSDPLQPLLLILVAGAFVAAQRWVRSMLLAPCDSQLAGSRRAR